MIGLNAGIALLSGAMMDYNNPAACDASIHDIAGALSNVCRFSGHLPQFYSVAQHAVNTSHIVDPRYEFDALMHDTAEAFTNDLPTPLKQAFPVFKELEVRIESAMADRFGFAYPLPDPVKQADLEMLGLEKVYVKRDYTDWEILRGVDYERHIGRSRVDLSPWTPVVAYNRFLERYAELAGG